MGTLSAVADRVRTAVGRADEALLSLRDGLTPGQRWTATLSMGLTALVLLYGLPHRVVVARATPGQPSTIAEAAGGGPRAPVAGVPVTAGAPVPGYPSPVVVTPTPQVPQAPAPQLPLQPPTPPPASAGAAPSFVALVRVGDRPVPGRDDASIAKVFLGHGGFPVTTLPVSSTDAGLCREAVAAGTVVLAGAGLERPLRDCLVQAGDTVISFDGLGDRPPIGAGGQDLSTRRGLLDSLLDLGRWGALAGTLHGRVGLVIDDAARDAIAGVGPALRALGVDIVSTVYVADDATSSSVTNGVRTFATAGVEVAVLAAPVAVQTRWVAQAAALAPGLQYVVADGFDAITNETYPASFDGAVSHTSLRVPWFARSHGETAAQAACRQTWDATVSPAQALTTDETVDVFTWCEEVTLVAAALGASAAFPSFGAALRSLRLVSPLTSDLGPLPNGGWGPTQDAAVTWHASCGCWQQKEPFTDRRSP